MTSRLVASLLVLLSASAFAQSAAPTPAPPTARRVLTLEEAITTARKNAPALRQARSNAQAAEARVGQARAPLLPQLSATASWQRNSANFVARPGSVPSQFTGGDESSWQGFDFFNGGLNLSQEIWNFGQTTGRLRASRASAEASQQSTRTTLQQTILGVETFYFNARAAHALVGVAEETLANQERHLAQIAAFVEVGTRPAIDLAQARTDRANAQFQLIEAQNSYVIAKAQLNQAMGVEGPLDYDVADETLPPTDAEEKSIDALAEEAYRARPELAALANQVRAQELTVKAVQGGYFPSLALGAGFTEAGQSLDALAWNWSLGVSLSWPLFQGGLTRSQVSEARANVSAAQAQLDAQRQQVRFDVEQAVFQVRAQRAAVEAAGEALANARERLRLAEGRYQTGVGNVIELGDAQLALTNAAAQRVRAEYQLTSARAQLAASLGRLAVD